MRALERLTSYAIAGAHFSPAFRAKRWDGKEHLLKYDTKHGTHAPAGLAVDIAAEFKRLDVPYKVVNRRHAHHELVALPWNDDIVLRPYQLEASDSLFRCQLPGVGLIKMPIRSGKTKTAADILRRIGRPAIFAVPSQMLLNQTIEALRDALPGVDIGQIGDSVYQEGFVTVATLQSLLRLRGRRADPGKDNGRPMDPRYRHLASTIDVFMCDEAHHITGEGDWHKIPYDFNAMFKVALSATAYLDDATEASRGIIWLKAIFGPKRIDVSTSDLVDKGYLMRQRIKMYEVNSPSGFKTAGWSATMRTACITHNVHRNVLIARLARKTSQNMGMKVLITADRYEHINAICCQLDVQGVTFRRITGRENRVGEREALVAGLLAGEYDVLIGTVLGEGIDIPEVECVINAEGGRDAKRVVQRQRNLTMAEGKRVALFIDFFDNTNQYLVEHSSARLDAYRAEPAFIVDLVK